MALIIKTRDIIAEQSLKLLYDVLLGEKDRESIITQSYKAGFETGRLQALNEALGVMPRKDEVEFKEALLTWSIRIKSLIDKK